MSTILLKIREHKKAATVIAAVVVLALFAAIILISLRAEEKRTNEGGEDSPEVTETEYFAESGYPVQVTAKEGKLTVRLDGSKSESLQWKTELSVADVASVTPDGSESGGVLTAEISPVDTGYATVVFTRENTVSGVSYEVARIALEVLVSADADGVMSASVADIKQSLSEAGAADTETPYLIKGNKVFLPNYGDWKLTPELTDGVKAENFIIFEGVDENDVYYYSVCMNFPDETADVSIPDISGNELTLSDILNAMSGSAEDSSETAEDVKETPHEWTLLLKSESLGIGQRLVCRASGNGEWALFPAEG